MYEPGGTTTVQIPEAGVTQLWPDSTTVTVAPDRATAGFALSVTVVVTVPGLVDPVRVTGGREITPLALADLSPMTVGVAEVV